MKKMLTILFIFFLSNPGSAFAHILQVDGDIGVILHINPEDDPIAGEPSHFHFDFTDTKDQFRPEKCLCTIDIYTGENKLFSFKLDENEPDRGKNGISFAYTFPKKAIYKVVLVGSPKELNGFQPFSLSYDVRVGRDSTGHNPHTDTLDNSPAVTVTALGGSLTFLTAMYILKMRRSKNVK